MENYHDYGHDHSSIDISDDNTAEIVMKDTKGKAVAEPSSHFSQMSSTSYSSSIGINTDCCDKHDSDEEVQSFLHRNSSCFDSMDALAAALPIKRGLSEHFDGKTNSFSCLIKSTSHLICSKVMAKPENPYSKKGRNSLAVNHSGRAGISKRPITSCKSMLTLAVNALTSSLKENPALPFRFRASGRHKLASESASPSNSTVSQSSSSAGDHIEESSTPTSPNSKKDN